MERVRRQEREGEEKGYTEGEKAKNKEGKSDIIKFRYRRGNNYKYFLQIRCSDPPIPDMVIIEELKSHDFQRLFISHNFLFSITYSFEFQI